MVSELPLLNPSNETIEMHDTMRGKRGKKKERNEEYKEKIQAPTGIMH